VVSQAGDDLAFEPSPDIFSFLFLAFYWFLKLFLLLAVSLNLS